LRQVQVSGRFLYPASQPWEAVYPLLLPANIALAAVSREACRAAVQAASLTAHAILRQLRAEKKEHLLQFFQTQRRDTRRQHSIWQDIQAKNIYSPEFLSEKMEYLHSNPVSKDWQLVKERGDYRYASACF